MACGGTGRALRPGLMRRINGQIRVDEEGLPIVEYWREYRCKVCKGLQIIEVRNEDAVVDSIRMDDTD